MNDWPFQVRYLEVCEMWSNFHPDPDGIPLNPGPFCTWVTLGWRNFQNLWGWCGKTILKSAPGHWRQVANHFCWGFLKKKDRMEDVRIVHKCEFISAHRYAFKSSHKHTSNTWLKAGFLASAQQENGLHHGPGWLGCNDLSTWVSRTHTLAGGFGVFVFRKMGV